MQCRAKKGGAIILTVSFTMIVVMIGVAFFFIIRLIGGGRELQNATDSGNLNTARISVKRPSITLNSGIESDNFGYLGDSNISAAIPYPVNLLTYNRLVAHTLLVSLNAADPTFSTPTAIANANILINSMQIGNNAVGARLARAMTNRQASNPLLTGFTFAADSNSTRMITSGERPSIDNNPQAFATAYMEQQPQIEANGMEAGRPGVTNIVVPNALQAMFPSLLALPQGGNANNSCVNSNRAAVPNDNNVYLRGYFPFPLPNSALNGGPIGVPLQPKQQPHLVSSKTFSAATNLTLPARISAIPPNAFKSKATSGITGHNGLKLSTLSYAKVGCLDSTYPLAIPTGYIEVDNSGLSNAQSQYDGNNVINVEMANAPGIIVNGNVFSTNPASIDALQNHLPPNDPPSPFPSDVYLLPAAGVVPGPTPAYSPPGIPLTPGNISRVQLNSQTACMDQSLDTTSGSYNQTCVNDLNTFQNTYFPQGWVLLPTPSSQLIAAECAKCVVERMYPVGGEPCLAGGAGAHCQAITGLVWFPRNSLDPDANRDCKGDANHPGTIRELGNHVYPSFGDQIVGHMANRMLEMLPTSSREAAIAFLDSNRIPLGEKAYIYILNNQFRWSVGTPGHSAPWVKDYTTLNLQGINVPDGKAITRKGFYSICSTEQIGSTNGAQAELASAGPYTWNWHGTIFMNSNSSSGLGDAGLHYAPFYNRPTDATSYSAIDTARYVPSSGYYNLLGVVKFSNQVSGCNSGTFSSPD